MYDLSADIWSLGIILFELFNKVYVAKLKPLLFSQYVAFDDDPDEADNNLILQTDTYLLSILNTFKNDPLDLKFFENNEKEYEIYKTITLKCQKKKCKDLKQRLKHLSEEQAEVITKCM